MPSAQPPGTDYVCRRAARHETVRVRGLDLHLHRWGPPPSAAEDSLVMLHGWLDTGATFQFLVDAFARDRPLVACDWRGFGQSGWAAEGYWFPDYLADLDALLELLAPQRPVRLLGHSMGGYVASLYAGVRPERVASVVNLEGFGLKPTTPGQAPARLRQWLAELRETQVLGEYASLDALAAVIRRRHPRIPPDRARHLASTWTQPAAGGRVRLRGDPRHKRVNPVLYRREEAEACWREIRAPMLLLAGAESGHWAGRDPAHPIPAVDTTVIEDAAHLLHIEQPQAVARVVEKFLDEHPPGIMS